MFEEFQPEAIVHLGECPSAPYSMIDVSTAVSFRRTTSRAPRTSCSRCRSSYRRPTWSSSGPWGSTARPTSRCRRGSSRSSTAGSTDRLPFPAPGRLLVPLEQGPRVEQHHVRLQAVGAAGDRHHAGRRVRYAHRRHGRGRPAADPPRLRPGVRHGGQSVLLPGADRPPAHAVRAGPPEARLPAAAGLDAVPDADPREPARPRRVPGVQPVPGGLRRHRAGAQGAAVGAQSWAATSRCATSRTRAWSSRTTSTPPTTRTCSTSATRRPTSTTSCG